MKRGDFGDLPPPWRFASDGHQWKRSRKEFVSDGRKNESDNCVAPRAKARVIFWARELVTHLRHPT